MKYGDKVLKEVDARLEELRNERALKAGELSALNDMVKKYERIRAILTGETKKKKLPVSTGKRLQRAKRSGSYTSLLEVFKNNPDSEYSAADFVTDFGPKQGAISTTLATLRRDGLIDLTRKGGRTGSTKYFKLSLSQKVEGE